MSLLSRLAERKIYLFVALAVLLTDQATKIAAHAWLPGRGGVTVVAGWFDLSYSRNPGGLFGYLGTLADPWRTLILTLVPIGAVVLIISFLLQTDEVDRPTLSGLGLILGGAVGNLIDRVFRGEVVDFLDVYAPAGRLADWFVARFGTAHWPTFNVADSAIVVGAGLLLLSIVRPQSAERPEAAGPQG